jgi:hypothetical protein
VTTLALIWGVLAFLGFCLALIPCLGWLNWVNIPFSIGSVIFSVIALARTSNARKPVSGVVASLILSLVAVIVGFVRLVLGGFVL